MTQSNTHDTFESLAAKRRWTMDDARRVLAARSAGETQAAFAARLGLDPGRLSRWRSRLRRGGSTLPRVKTLRASRPAARPKEIVLADAGPMTLGRRSPCAVVELVEGRVRVEVWRPEMLDVCIEALLARRRK